MKCQYCNKRKYKKIKWEGLKGFLCCLKCFKDITKNNFIESKLERVNI